MRAGRLDRRIIIQRRTGALTTSGQPFDVWNDVATRWASVGPLSGNERFSTPQLVAKEIVEIQIRHSSATADIHPGDRVVFPSSADPDATPTAVYDILSVHEIGRREGQKLLAERLPVPDSGIPDPFDPVLVGVYFCFDPFDLATLLKPGGAGPVTADGDLVGSAVNKGSAGGTWLNDVSDAVFHTADGLRWVTTGNGFLFPATLPQPFDFVVGARRGGGSDSRLFFTFGPNGVTVDRSQPNVQMFAGNTVPVPLSLPTVNTDIILSGRFDGPNSRIALDDGDYFAGLNVGTNGIGSEVLGGGDRLAQALFFPPLTDLQMTQARMFVAERQGRVFS